ncbi:hypothetical protein Taro_053176 [Colocasia esculenta]|uniref:Uncharacterized protein n=1 Tax=Colocasia esculenta TaxID=4460 RepID=A0A843XLV3_COLES|nr:hypothetical protein [Colocasia esculenta]
MIGGGARGPAAAMMMPTAMAMKCKKHPYEQGVGVCASCLRERLLELVAAQTGRAQQLHSGGGGGHQFQRSLSGAAAQQIPPPLVFPRSVSPYVSRRRSVDLDLAGGVGGDCDGGGRRLPLRFFSTPQVGPGEGRWKPARGGFLASLFGGGHHPRSEEVEPEFMAPSASHRSGSWFSSLLQGRRKKKQQQKKKETNVSRFFEEASMREEEDGRRRSAWRRGCDFGGEEDDSASESGYSTESSGGWRIPAPTPMRKHASSAHRTMSGFVVCLSPLVRASPRRTQTGEGGAAPGPSGELRGARASSLPRHLHHHRHGSGLGGSPALGPNRSRNLADVRGFR